MGDGGEDGDRCRHPTADPRDGRRPAREGHDERGEVDGQRQHPEQRHGCDVGAEERRHPEHEAGGQEREPDPRRDRPRPLAHDRDGVGDLGRLVALLGRGILDVSGRVADPPARGQQQHAEHHVARAPPAGLGGHVQRRLDDERVRQQPEDRPDVARRVEEVGVVASRVGRPREPALQQRPRVLTRKNGAPTPTASPARSRRTVSRVEPAPGSATTASGRNATGTTNSTRWAATCVRGASRLVATCV